jgi:hypothetical protein
MAIYSGTDSTMDEGAYKLLHQRHRGRQGLVQGLGWVVFVATLSYGVNKGRATTHIQPIEKAA